MKRIDTHTHTHPVDSMPWGKREVFTVVLIVRECIEEDQVGSHVCGGRLPLCPVDLEHTVGDKEELPLICTVAVHNSIIILLPPLPVLPPLFSSISNYYSCLLMICINNLLYHIMPQKFFFHPMKSFKKVSIMIPTDEGCFEQYFI
jgi:hypothetical protein